ncbi:MAG: hypothetical protein ACJA0J_000334 [Bdellovibrionota bacterium]|jgi:hypothetical protein
MERKQRIMLAFGMLGVLGIQIGCYELIKDRAPKLVIYGLVIVGFLCAFKGFGEYRRIEDEETE